LTVPKTYQIYMGIGGGITLSQFDDCLLGVLLHRAAGIRCTRALIGKDSFQKGKRACLNP